MYIFVKKLNDMKTENKKPENPFAFAMCDDISFMQHGMTLRDYFAAKAMQGILSAQTEMRAIGMQSNHGHNQVESLCEESYTIADAMLKQRGL